MGGSQNFDVGIVCRGLIKKIKNRTGINDIKQSQGISGFGIVFYIKKF